VYKDLIKIILDFVFSLAIGILIIPILFLFIILIAAESKGPIFFKQERLGKGGETFVLLKLRSMKINHNRVEKQVHQNDPDITMIGKFIRRYKIDELPQIYNVLIGHMSIVGPRPCLPSLKEKFDENAFHRLKVKPGLTGWAQVNGNIYNSWPKRWELDRYYVENLSFKLDLKILLMTIGVVLFGEKK
jgi:undecaprenyl phosphate N,N'-diacetylbacillosamine 1-phosphate transferase